MPLSAIGYLSPVSCALGSDGAVYGMPHAAGRVLRVEPDTSRVTLIGPDFGSTRGRCKWSSCCMGADGILYGVPDSSSEVLRITPATPTSSASVDTVGTDLGIDTADGKWIGAILAADGCIYAMPFNATRVLKIDPAQAEVSTVGIDLVAPTAGKTNGGKWHGGHLAADGCIYGVPFNAARVLKVDPACKVADASVSLIGEPFRDGGVKWSGGALSRSGLIFAAPFGAAHVLCIDPATQSAYEIGPTLPSSSDEIKYEGAVETPSGVYSFPNSAGDDLLHVGGDEPWVDGETFWRAKARRAFELLGASAVLNKSAVSSAEVHAAGLASLLLPIPHLIELLVKAVGHGELSEEVLCAFLKLPGARAKLLEVPREPLAFGGWLLAELQAETSLATAYLEAVSSAASRREHDGRAIAEWMGALQLTRAELVSQQEALIEVLEPRRRAELSAEMGANDGAAARLSATPDLTMPIVRRQRSALVSLDVPRTARRISRSSSSRTAFEKCDGEGGASGAACGVTLLSTVLDVRERAARSRLFGLRIVELAMSQESSVGPWLVERLGAS